MPKKIVEEVETIEELETEELEEEISLEENEVSLEKTPLLEEDIPLREANIRLFKTIGTTVYVLIGKDELKRIPNMNIFNKYFTWDQIEHISPNEFSKYKILDQWYE